MATVKLEWEKIARANVHPLQITILEIVKGSDKALSPTELAEELDRDLGVVSYHVRKLAKIKLLKKKRQQQVRGAIQTFYVIGDV